MSETKKDLGKDLESQEVAEESRPLGETLEENQRKTAKIQASGQPQRVVTDPQESQVDQALRTRKRVPLYRSEKPLTAAEKNKLREITLIRRAIEEGNRRRRKKFDKRRQEDVAPDDFVDRKPGSDQQLNA